MTDPTTPSPERQPADAGGGLLPCPFCGGAGALRGYGQGHWGGCSECGMHGPCRSTKPEAIVAWNRRTPAPQAQPDARAVEALRRIERNPVSFSHAASQLARETLQALSAPAADDGWRDKAEGLESDLRSAVQVAWRRGAKEWARLNYPQYIDWLEASDALSQPEPSQ